MLDYAQILKFDEGQHPRHPGGTAEGGRFARSPHEQKRRDFMALVKREEREEVNLQRMRVEVAGLWKVWADDTKNRKKPLKPDGAAAKKLESYKKAKALEDVFHARFDTSREKQRELTKQAHELLKVSEEQRSKVTFKEDKQSPFPSHQRAEKVLSDFNQFDGSGAFIPATFPADTNVENVTKIFGGVNPFVKNPDGTYAIPSTLLLGKSNTKRAYATGLGINLVAGMGVELERSLYHEVAHHIEVNLPGALRAAIELRESLANKPREVFKLKEVNPALGDDEIAVRGKFPDPYVGKLYPNDSATELISMGVESYMVDPVGFARNRPEHFNLIFDVMHGKYRKA